MNLENKKILITSKYSIWNSLVEKFNNYKSKILATGTNEEKLESLKKKYNVETKVLSLDEHDKIEGFVEEVSKNSGAMTFL